VFAEVMVRLSSVPVRRSTAVVIEGMVGWETAAMEAWVVEGHKVGPWYVGDVRGEGDEGLSVVSESGSAK
jgi:hypothetical protein